MFWGGILWAYVIGNMTQVLGNIDTDELAFRVQYDQLNEMMADKGIHLELRIRVRRYLKESRTILKINKEAEFEEILGDVVGMRLHREVQSQIYDRGWVSLACFGKLWRARSRLYRSQILQLNTRWN